MKPLILGKRAIGTNSGRNIDQGRNRGDYDLEAYLGRRVLDEYQRWAMIYEK